MIALAILACGLLADAPPADDRSVYESKRAQAGRDPAAHVKLALWCESHGMPAERLRHLAIAVITDPSNLAARSLMGLVADGGAWRKPDEIAARAKADAKLSADRAEYQTRRAAAKDDADSQSRLAAWCEERGLHAEAKAHLYRVVRLDPKRESAWKKLGYRKHDGVWMTDAQIAASKAESIAQSKADRHWKPILERANELLGGSETRKVEARNTLAAVSDPRAVPMVLKVFATSSEADQRVAAQVLGQIDAPAASRALAFLAAFGKSSEVRRVATETLKQRDPREFAGVLIALLRKPVRYTVKHVGGPGQPGELFIEGERYDRKRTYSPPPAPNFVLGPRDQVVYDANGMPVIDRPIGFIEGQWVRAFDMIAAQNNFEASVASPTNPLTSKLRGLGLSSNQAQALEAYYSPAAMYSTDYAILQGSLALTPANKTTVLSFDYAQYAQIPIGRLMAESRRVAASAEQQLQGDVAFLEAYNAPIRQMNDRVLPILKVVSSQDLGDDPIAWQTWLVDQMGYALRRPQVTARETIVENVPLDSPAQQIPITFATSSIPFGFSRMSCFGAGTPVRTLDGNRPIESLDVGDLVLAQDESTGAISYQPVLIVHRNPPAATLKIDLGGEKIISSTYHRFWKPGFGWAMARELKPGDRIRTLGGVATVKEIGAEKVQPVFNLDVAESKTFFVGETGVLAHDNSVPDRRATPFDAMTKD